MRQSIEAVSTSTTVSKVRGFTVELLFLLKDQALRTVDLTELTGKTSQYVFRYLYNMRKYGLVERNSPFWKLTSEGVSFLSYLESLINININIRKIYERKKKDIRKIYETYDPKKLKQVSLQSWLRNSSLQDSERAVVEVLVNHYNQTGSKFFYCRGDYEISEKFQIPITQINEVFMHLKQDHIVYIFHDKQHGALKIGLYKDFLASLDPSLIEGPHAHTHNT